MRNIKNLQNLGKGIEGTIFAIQKLLSKDELFSCLKYQCIWGASTNIILTEINRKVKTRVSLTSGMNSITG